MNHIEARHTNCQIQKVFPEKERQASQYTLDIEDSYGQFEPGHLLSIYALSESFKFLLELNLFNPYFAVYLVLKLF